MFIATAGLLLATVLAFMWVAFAVWWASPMETKRMQRAEERRVRKMIEGPFETERERGM